MDYRNLVSGEQMLRATGPEAKANAGAVAAYLVKGLGGYFSVYLMTDVGQRVVMDIRNALYRHILDQSAGFFAHGATGRLLSRINNDVGQVQQAVSDVVKLDDIPAAKTATPTKATSAT